MVNFNCIWMLPLKTKCVDYQRTRALQHTVEEESCGRDACHLNQEWRNEKKWFHRWLIHPHSVRSAAWREREREGSRKFIDEVKMTLQLCGVWRLIVDYITVLSRCYCLLLSSCYCYVLRTGPERCRACSTTYKSLVDCGIIYVQFLRRVHLPHGFRCIFFFHCRFSRTINDTKTSYLWEQDQKLRLISSLKIDELLNPAIVRNADFG